MWSNLAEDTWWDGRRITIPTYPFDSSIYFLYTGWGLKQEITETSILTASESIVFLSLKSHPWPQSTALIRVFLGPPSSSSALTWAPEQKLSKWMSCMIIFFASPVSLKQGERFVSMWVLLGHYPQQLTWNSSPPFTEKQWHAWHIQWLIAMLLKS